MKTNGPEPFGTYRCPVCGHRDTLDLADEPGGRRIECSYCGAALEVGGIDPGTGRLNVRLVDSTDGGGGTTTD